LLGIIRPFFLSLYIIIERKTRKPKKIYEKKISERVCAHTHIHMTVMVLEKTIHSSKKPSMLLGIGWDKAGGAVT